MNKKKKQQNICAIFGKKKEFQVKVLLIKQKMDYNSAGSMMHKDDDFDGYSHVNHNPGNGSHSQANKSGMSKAELRKVGLDGGTGRL